FPVHEQKAFSARTGDTDVRLPRFPGTVDSASEYCNFKRSLDIGDIFLDLIGDGNVVYFYTAACRTGDECRCISCESVSFEYLLLHFDLFNRICLELIPQRVDDSLGNDGSETSCTLYGSCEQRPTFCDAKVKRVVECTRHFFVCFNRK